MGVSDVQERQTLSPDERDRDEERDAFHRAPLRAAVVHAVIEAEGEDTLSRTVPALLWSALGAGLSMGFSLFVQALLLAHLPAAPWRPLLTTLGYPVGFLLVILGRQQLFTQDTLTVILPLLDRRDARTLAGVARVWGAVLMGNLLGAFVVGLAAAHTAIFQPPVKRAIAEVARAAVDGAFATTLLQAIVAGWLIALIVWMLPTAGAGRVFVIVAVTYVVGLAGFPQIVTAAVEVFYLATTDAASFRLLATFLLPTLIGNALGGVALVAVLNHEQVVAGGHKKPRESETAGTV